MNVLAKRKALVVLPTRCLTILGLGQGQMTAFSRVLPTTVFRILLVNVVKITLALCRFQSVTLLRGHNRLVGRFGETHVNLIVARNAGVLVNMTGNFAGHRIRTID